MPKKNRKTVKIIIVSSSEFLIIVLFFFWVSFGINPGSIVKYFVAQVGSEVGVSVSVPPNPFNQIARQLKEKEISLLEKEKELEQKEAELGEKNISEGENRFLFIILGGGFLLLLILIILNFYLDYRKSKGNQ
jgi:hypothetical protein